MRRLAIYIVLIALVVLAMILPATIGGCSAGDAASIRSLVIDEAMQNLGIAATLMQQVVNRKTVAAPAVAYLSGLQDQQKVGIIEIPRIGVREWIVHGTSEESLRRGAGHIVGTSIPGMGGNFTVAGDRVLYSAPFLRVNELTAGDKIIAHLPYGIFHYVVESVIPTSPTDVSVLDFKGYETITLSTCDPPWSLGGRLTVSARLVATYPGPAPS